MAAYQREKRSRGTRRLVHSPPSINHFNLLTLSPAESYKEYNKLRKKSAPSQQPQIDTRAKNDESKVLKERPANVASATPKKSNKTVNKLSPLPERTPAHVRTALGPTPHKDGQVLSIFDMVPNGTPSRNGQQSTAPLDDVISATPSKPAASASRELFSRTPQSSGKRYYLDSFAGTPLKRKREGELDTPMTVKRQYMTPMFLRRSTSLATVQEDSQASGVSRQPLKKKGLARNLSTIIQGLRNLQEDQMDDEWDILNDVEGGEGGQGVPKIFVEDSQAAAMPLGPDRITESADDEAVTDPGALDAEGKPRKVWKKKGLKRQTRRVIMRPVMHKPKKATEVEEGDSEEDENHVVGGTQLDEPDEEFGDDDHEERHDSQQSQHESQRKGTKKKQSKPAKEEGKKVAADAHANFRKLKIKNKNSKASGRGKKFGRR
jgi:DNA replication regulator SLD2